ncbi:alkaline phosphatase [Candidatus Moduliflexus flocculans]|uniref:Alkaline phosphatase n=1 Tax=Candidatus Moduliflexus flocculans TaxID=1499966 RepID=A0A081BQL2_9BACT|nr:alkaline phosphatase [Candidatus Moduliflexus flocculans]
MKRYASLFSVLMLVCAATLSFSAQAEEMKKAKYVMLFIGDGMAMAQRYAAELSLSNGAIDMNRPQLLMNTFPAQGLDTTFDLTSIIPDSSSTGTAIASGFKTESSVLGTDPTGEIKYKSIAETAKEKGWKVGILSTVSLDHATPAVFYAHQKSRNSMYEISMELANSGFDFFGGGQLKSPTSKEEGKPNALDTAKANGYTIAMGRAELEALKPGAGKVIAMNDLVDSDAAMYYTIDQPEGYVTIAEYTAKAIELLDNPDGFFMMVEGGKIDWACHANDAAAAIQDTLAFDAAIAEGMKFYEKHPDETLIIVTGDHETGGLSIGYAGTKYSSYISKMKNQKVSYLGFNAKLEEFKKANPAAKFEDVLPLIKEAFGLYVLSAEEKATLKAAIDAGKAKDAADDVKKAAKEAENTLKYGLALTDADLAILQDAFAVSMLAKDARPADDVAYVQYGGYEPLTVKLTTILAEKAGIGWSSYSHTGGIQQTSAIGAGAELFNGYYDQTDIYKKMMTAAGFELTTASAE